MIRFSHEANSWQFKAILGTNKWINITPAEARWLVDRNVIVNVS